MKAGRSSSPATAAVRRWPRTWPSISAKVARATAKKRFRVLSLTDNVPWITAVGNDISYDDIFVEQLQNYAQKGDVLLAISGSGNSKNILKALKYANEIGCTTVGISGFKGGALKELVTHHIHAKADHMGLIEDAQLIVCHILMYAFMETEGCG